MTDTNQKESKASEESQGTGFTFSCCDFKTMAQMMKNFCGSQNGGFDCERYKRPFQDQNQATLFRGGC